MRKVLKIKCTDTKEKEFSTQQNQVINFNEGPLLVASVAGAGKTTVLVERIKNLINNKKVNPTSILAVTFTKKAANEMNERLNKIGIDTDIMQVSTFHSVCLKILKQEYKTISEFSENFEVDGTGSMETNLLKYVLGFQNMNWKNSDIGEVKRHISLWKNELVRPFEANHFEPKFVEAYKLFEKFREQRNFFTFDDMLIRCWELFDKYPFVLAKYQKRFKYVLVDECQDMNFSQLRLTEIFAAPENNIMLCGDDDQSIYAFRGAIPDYMINFEKNFNATVIKMEKNYRCQSQQLDIANRLIEKNLKRILKILIPTQGDNGDVCIAEFVDAEEEGYYIKEKIKELIFEGSKRSGIAVLYRTNAQSRAIEDELIKEGIPYELVGGINFYQRREIRDILAYVKTAIGIEVEDNIKRIINVPFRYLGKAFLETVERYAIHNNCSYEEALLNVPCKPNQNQSVNEFMSILNFIRENYKLLKPNELLQSIIDKTNYIEFLKKEEGENEEENSRVVNLRELVRASSKYQNIEKFLDYIKLMQKKRKNKNDKADKVVLSTIHRSKGLEWNDVFMIGVNEGILPHGKAEDVEEERRICFVGMTRSRSKLYISYLNTTLYGAGFPSRFLYDAELIAKVEEVKEIVCEEI